MDLELELRELAAAIAWPLTPGLRPELAPERRAMPRRGLVAIVIAVVAAAVGAAFAVPQSRGAILRFLDLGSVHVEFVDRLPPARERSLAADPGRPVSMATARDLLHEQPLQPSLRSAPTLHARDGVVSQLFLHDGEPVLLSEIGGSGGPVLKKIALAGTSVRWLTVAHGPAVWLTADRHVVVFPHATARLAGHVLVWQHGDLTLRLEGAHLSLRDALSLAGKIG
jgi:hypothetical protein